MNGGALSLLAHLGALLLFSFVVALPFALCPSRFLASRSASRLTQIASRFAFGSLVLGFAVPLSILLRFRTDTGAWPTNEHFRVIEGELVYTVSSMADAYPGHYLLAEVALALAFLAVLLYVPSALAGLRARALVWREPVAFLATYALLCAWPFADPGGFYWMFGD